MLKKIFSSYGTDKKNLKVMTCRKLCQMAKDFNFFRKIKNLDEIKLQLLFIKKVPNKIASFREFVDLLYHIAKLKESNPLIENRIIIFKKFLDELIVPKYKDFSKHLIQFTIDDIQIFYKNYNPYENPTVNLLAQNEDLFKHVKFFSLIL